MATHGDTDSHLPPLGAQRFLVENSPIEKVPTTKPKVDYSEQPVDYVLIYNTKGPQTELREKFETILQNEELLVQKEIIGNEVFVMICSNFDRLCREAERVKLQMPLKGVSISSVSCSCIYRFSQESQ